MERKKTPGNQKQKPASPVLPVSGNEQTKAAEHTAAPNKDQHPAHHEDANADSSPSNIGMIRRIWTSLTVGERCAAILGIMGFVLAGVSLYILNKQTDAMIAQNDLMKTQMLLDQRAWVGIQSIKFDPITPSRSFNPFTDEEPLATITAVVEIQNSGKTPGINVTVLVPSKRGCCMLST